MLVMVDRTQQPSPDLETVVDGVGARLRNLRRARALTLADLAAATGTSQATLSRLESGRRRADLTLLLRLAQVFRVTLDEMVDAPPTGDPRVHARPSVRYGTTWVPLTRRPGGLQAYKVIIPGGFRPPGNELQSHQGYEWMYVLDGRLRLWLGEQELTLTPGEVAEFDTHTPHGFANPGPTPTDLLMIISAEGHRVHVRARPITKD